ncbi:MAG: A/G-specific adenine glycosylase [Pirellulaceae bacterium]|nr:A/G-specific adenine glycosylase [Pirellulaceae bacterium]
MSSLGFPIQKSGSRKKLPFTEKQKGPDLILTQKTKMAKTNSTAPSSRQQTYPFLLRQEPSSKWFQRLRSHLRKWFAVNKRDLPWRKNRDPYRIWLSEVMLQQTQVVTVVDYFNRFTSQFPTIQQLAAAPEETVLSLWEGLGYYRRARNMHAAAKIIATQFDGQFPNNLKEVMALPGIGRYSAGAILSIAFDQRHPILEGNTFRLHSRLLGVNADPRSKPVENYLWEFSTRVLPQRRTGDFNQALMEIGSEICKPKKPDCQHCPLAKLCAANALGIQSELPISGKKTIYEPRNQALVIVHSHKQFLARKRTSEEWWSGLWDFFRIDTSSENDATNRRTIEAELQEQIGISISLPEKPTKVIRHGVTKYRIRLACYSVAVDGPMPNSKKYSVVTQNELETLPLNITARQFLSCLPDQDC